MREQSQYQSETVQDRKIDTLCQIDQMCGLIYLVNLNKILIFPHVHGCVG